MKKESSLSPYRVLDLADETGSMCGHILAMLGADVIKVEKPGGDPSRHVGPFYGDDVDPEKSLHWFAYNAGKRSITLDIESTVGRDILERLVASSDFLVQSFSPGYMESLGLGYTELNSLRNGIIVVSITPFGLTGSYKDFKGNDIVAMAMSGVMSYMGEPDRAPLRFSVDQAFAHASAQGAAGALIALYFRNLSGEGQVVDISLQESLLPAAWLAPFYWDYLHLVSKRVGARLYRAVNARRIVYPCSDGYVSWQLLMGRIGRRTRAMVEIMDAEGMAGELKDVAWEETDYDLVPAQRFQAWEELFGAFFLTKTKAWLYENGKKKGTVLMPFNTTEDLLKDRQLLERDFWIDREHPELGTSLIYPGAPFKATEPLLESLPRAPFIGEHNRQVYVDELGFSLRDMEQLNEAHVV